MKNFTVGVDIGGTNVKLGLVSRSGKVVARSNFATRSYINNRQRFIDALVHEIQALLSAHGLHTKDVCGIGIGLPGLLDPVKGIVIFLPNIPNWENVPLKKILEKRLGIKTFLGNDVKLVTLGEWKFGAGRGYKNLVCITLGTGVGSGLVLNNELYMGEGFVAGEIGHMPLNEEGPACRCGGYACFQAYAGNRRLLARAGKILHKKNTSFLELRQLARRGDKRVLAFWKEAAAHIGNNLVGVVNLLNPPLIIIGGGVSNNHEFLFNTIRKVIKRRAMSVHSAMVKIVRTKLGDDAGIIGAQVLVSTQIRKK